MNPGAVRRRFGAPLERTLREMNGTACMALEDNAKARQQIVRSRSFGRPCGDVESIVSAVSVHACDALRALRRQKSLAGTVGVFFCTDPFRPDLPQRSASLSADLEIPCADVITLTEAAVGLARSAWQPGFAYKKGGVVLTNLSPAGGEFMPESLFSNADPKRMHRLERLQPDA